jgi:hypothetical protein
MNKIIFHSNREYNLHIKDYYPESTYKVIPKWYSEADKYIKNPNTEEYALNYDGEKMPSFKACPAILDFFISGYVIKTPCDLFFYEKNGIMKVKSPEGYEDFCATRPPMPGFIVPNGYIESPFHWYPSWSPELPDGYSAIYLNPVNRYDLPFMTVSGIIDNDKLKTPGLMPFFLQKNFKGLIPAGTPFVQIIPFKREDWESELKIHNQEEIINRFAESSKEFRKPGGDVYKKYFWSRRKYK